MLMVDKWPPVSSFGCMHQYCPGCALNVNAGRGNYWLMQILMTEIETYRRFS